MKAQEFLPGTGPLGPGGRDYAHYRFEDAPGSNGSPAVTDHRLDAGVVISSTTRESCLLYQRFGHFGLNGDSQIPNGGPIIPRSLWSEDLGIRYFRQMDRGRVWGVNASVGSDSDRLFNSMHETSVLGMVDLKIPSRQRNAWLLSLSYSNNRYFANGVPLPGVAYQFQSASGRFRGLIGFPFAALFWTPAPGWDARASAFGPRRWSLDIGKLTTWHVRLHGGFEWGGQTWLRAGRTDIRQTLNFERKRLYAGFESRLWHGLILDVSGGRQFDQYFYETATFSGTGPKASLPAGWYGASSIAWRFGEKPSPHTI